MFIWWIEWMDEWVNEWISGSGFQNNLRKHYTLADFFLLGEWLHESHLWIDCHTWSQCLLEVSLKPRPEGSLLFPVYIRGHSLCLNFRHLWESQEPGGDSISAFSWDKNPLNEKMIPGLDPNSSYTELKDFKSSWRHFQNSFHVADMELFFLVKGHNKTEKSNLLHSSFWRGRETSLQSKQEADNGGQRWLGFNSGSQSQGSWGHCSAQHAALEMPFCALRETFILTSVCRAWEARI